MTDVFSDALVKKAIKTTDKEVISEENGIIHLGINEEGNHIWQYHLDGDVYEKNKPPVRCDYLLLNTTKEKAFFVELKGVEEDSGPGKADEKLRHAAEQLETSYEDIRPAIPAYAVCFRIVYKRTPRKKPSILRKWENRAPFARKAIPSGEPDSID